VLLHSSSKKPKMSQVPVAPPNTKECDPRALALGDFLRHHKLLKQRQGILNGKRQEFFRVKRAIRALESPEYQKALKRRGSKLPSITNRSEALEAFRLLPLNRLAFRVQRLETQAALKAGLKPAKGVPVLVIQPRQEFGDDMYYVWFHEPVQLITYVYAALALVAIFAVVLFPLWPVKMRIGVWYLSVGLLGLLGVFFGIAIVRLILFSITYFVASPGLWIFPNLFEDVGFIDSFIPLYAWHGQSALPQEQKQNAKDRKKNRNEMVGLEALGGAAAQMAGGDHAGHNHGGPPTPGNPAAGAGVQGIPGAPGPNPAAAGIQGLPRPGQAGPLTPQQQFSLMLSQRMQMRAKEHNEKYGPPKTPQEAQQLQAKFVQEELQKIKEEVQAKARQAGPLPGQEANLTNEQSDRPSPKRIVTLEDDNE
jgi:translocation protein SEC62